MKKDVVCHSVGVLFAPRFKGLNIMKMANDQATALRYLEIKSSGYSAWTFYRRFLLQYSILLVCFCIFVTLSLLLEGGSLLVAFAIGISTGVLLRDVFWLRTSRATWQFNNKVVDWDKVQRIAEGDAL